MRNIFTFKEYREEMELIETQNKVECDLYSIIVYLIRETQRNRGVSVRDVSARRSTTFSNIFKGCAGFPDFVIRTREKNNNARILGAVEVKYLAIDLDNIKNLRQLHGHVSKYKKVVYTNGLEWSFYNKNEMNPEWSICLGRYDNGKIVWFEEPKWEELLKLLSKIDWNP